MKRLLAIFLLLPLTANAEVLAGRVVRVVRVVDGDTLYGINAT